MTAERKAALVENARQAFMDAMLAEKWRDPIAAALTVALEEAARVANDYEDDMHRGPIATAIRALIPDGGK